MPETEVTELNSFFVLMIPFLFLFAIYFFSWMYRKINKIPPTEAPEETDEIKLCMKRMKEEDPDAYPGEGILRFLVFLVYLISIVISEDQQHSMILTVAALFLSRCISFLYDRRKEQDARARLREERWEQGIYEAVEEEEDKPLVWFLKHK